MNPFLSALGLDRLRQNELQDNDSESSNIQLSLNPHAIPFTPNTSNSNSPLSPIAEYDENEWICDNSYPSNDNLLKLRNIIFISTDITRNALRKDAIIKEYFSTEQDLFYHLRWQCRMQVIDKKYKIFKSNINNNEVIIFHSDLHDLNNNNLYIIGIKNDINKSHSVKWKMIQFMTKNEIYSEYNINNNNLPLSSHNSLYKKTEFNKIKYMKDIKKFEIDINKLIKVEQIKKKPSIQPLIVTFTEFEKALIDCISLYELLPIVWFDKKLHNANYKIQMLLPIKLQRNNWIGIVFDYNNNKQLIPVTICVDHIDIKRKLALFKPFNNSKEYKWFVNSISEIKTTNDEYETLIWLKNERIKELEKIIKERDEEIKRLKSLKGNENLQD